MPGTFTRSFAARLDSQCDLAVREAAGGEVPRRGTVFIASGEAHLRVELSASEPLDPTGGGERVTD